MVSYCVSKDEAKRQINVLMHAARLPRSENYPGLSELIKDAESAPDPYLFIGEELSDAEAPFDGIVYREDLCEYLLSLGCDRDGAVRLSEIVRKGTFGKSDIPEWIPSLSDRFCAWARGVRYLPSRSIFGEEFSESLSQG